MIDLPPLRIGVFGETRLAEGITFQVKASPGLNLLWSGQNPDLLQEQAVDVLVEASNSTSQGAEIALAALKGQTHLVLTNPAIDLAIGPLLHATAYQNGLLVSSDAGTRHGALAALIQEARIMGFEIMQAGAVCDENSTRLQMELACLANSFGFLPPSDGMSGPEVANLSEVLGAFDFEAYEGQAHIDYVTCPPLDGSLYLVVKPMADLPRTQSEFLKDYRLGDGPYYLLHRPYHLGHLETPKTILGAAAGQAILPPGEQGCQVVAAALEDLPAGTSIHKALKASQMRGIAVPSHPDHVPLALLDENTVLQKDLSRSQAVTFDHIELPDVPLTHRWVEQLGLLED